MDRKGKGKERKKGEMKWKGRRRGKVGRWEGRGKEKGGKRERIRKKE